MKTISEKMQRLIDSLPNDAKTPEAIAAENADIAAAQSGDTTAYERVTKNNMRLVVALAYRYAECDTHSRLDLEDLIAAGWSALARAVLAYDPRNAAGASFATLARHYACGAFSHARRETALLRKSQWVDTRRLKARDEYAERVAAGEDASPAAIAKAVGLQPTPANCAKIEIWLTEYAEPDTVSLDEPTSGGEGLALCETIGDEHSDFSTRLARGEAVGLAMRRLAELPSGMQKAAREYLAGRSGEDTARDMGMTRQGVRRAREAAFAAIRG